MPKTTRDTRGHILAVGRRLTAQRGYTGVGLSDLLREAGVPKGSFYHYFASKEAYGCALLQTFVDDYDDKLAATLRAPAKSGREQLLLYFKGWRRMQLSERPEDRCLVVRLSAEVAELSPPMSALLRHCADKATVALAETIAAGQRDGSIRSGLSAADTGHLLYHLWLGASLLAAISHSDEALQSALHTTERLLDRD